MNHKSENHELQKELDELKQNILDIKETVIKKLSKQVDKIPDSIQQGEDKVASTIETHPFSSVGWAAAIGFILGTIFTTKLK